jgi:hypothetical protein
LLDSYSILINEIDIESFITKRWSRFKTDIRYVIDSISYQDVKEYQNSKIKIVKGIYLYEYITENKDIIKTLLDINVKSSDINQIKAIKNQIDYVHGIILMKGKLKEQIRVRCFLGIQ